MFDRPLLSLPGEVVDVNEIYLEIAARRVQHKGIMVFMAVSGIPMILAVVIGAVWAMLEGVFLDTLWIVLFMLLMLFMGASMIYPAWTMAFFAPAYEPIRFCRRDRKVVRYGALWRLWGGMEVFRFGKANIRIHDWNHCRAEVVYLRDRRAVANLVSQLELVFRDPLTNEVTERFQIGQRDGSPNFRNRVLLWETIRRYMENGLADIPPPVVVKRCETLADYIDAFNPFSMPARFQSRPGRVFGYVLGAIMWVLIVPLLPFVIGNWLVRRLERPVDWGTFGDTMFRLAPGDPALQASLSPASVMPLLRGGECERRRTAARLWFISVILQIAGISWWIMEVRSYPY